jgi:hypothetical protein
VLWPSYTSHLNLRPCKQNLALKLPSARRTALYLFGIRLASLEVIEEHPLVLAFHPPELPPHVMILPARATHHDHPLTTSSEGSFDGLYPVRQ